MFSETNFSTPVIDAWAEISDLGRYYSLIIEAAEILSTK